MTAIYSFAAIYMVLVTIFAYLFSKEIDSLEKQRDEMKAAMFKLKDKLDSLNGKK